MRWFLFWEGNRGEIGRKGIISLLIFDFVFKFWFWFRPFCSEGLVWFGCAMNGGYVMLIFGDFGSDSRELGRTYIHTYIHTVHKCVCTYIRMERKFIQIWNYVACLFDR